MKIGWILDVYAVAQGMCVWILDEEGQAFSYLDPWFPRFYKQPDFSKSSPKIVQKKDFFSHQLVPVVEVRLKNPLLYSRVVQKFPNDKIFNADLNLGQYYFYERGVFPLARCSFEADQNGLIQNWNLEDSPWELDYRLPPLRYAHLGLPEAGDPNHHRRGCYLLTLGRELGKGTTYLMDESEGELIRSLNRHIADWDPDILLTDWGDSYIMPRLELYSRRSGVPLLLSRDPSKYVASAAARSYFSYGKMIYKAGSRTLFGRLHIDTKNSFTFGQTDLDGLFEIARVAKIPIQRAARCTIGTSLSSMQHEWAIKNDYLIPLDKGQTEDFRPAEDLIAADRGGLVYEPEIGWHEDVIEFDFVSMYPEIMICHNVSPEAVNCACCPDNKVPGINHHLCRRTGMIPAVLGPLVDKRSQYKKLIKEGHPKSKSFQARRDSFKWALVTCFGYLGFRNARFGKIEAHECVNAYSREALLRAKEIAEAEGFHFLHGIVDSLWLKKPHATDLQIEDLRKKIEEGVGLPLGYEGRYHWIRFCPSKINALVGVPNRYYGAFNNGEIKVRGIELRRHDTPLFIKALQSKLLEVMAQAHNLAELDQLKTKIDDIIFVTRDRLKSGHMAALELAVSIQLTRVPSAYLHDTLSALAAKKLEACGVTLHVGETIQYVVSAERDKVKDWRVTPLALIEGGFEYDQRYYERLIERAIEIISFSKKESKLIFVGKGQLELIF